MNDSLNTITKDVEFFLTSTEEARDISEKCRDYFDHKQWTDSEAQKLRKRNQAPIVVNRVRPKVKGLIGLYSLRQSDPKAYPRTQKHEKSSHAITDALRYVSDNVSFNDTKTCVAEDFFVEGYGGAIVEIKKRRDELEIEVNQIPWDRIYFDPHSRRKDFKDARFLGFYMWIDKDQVKEMFGKDYDSIVQNMTTDETFEDRPRWVDKETNRIRVAVHYWKKGGWKFGVFCEDTWLIKEQDSPYLDEDGLPCCPIELVCANIDRDNNRYGEVLGYLDQQDEINHRRSKALHQISSRQTHGRKGAVQDIPKLKRELAKPDGHVEWNGEEFGKDFGIIPNNDMTQGQFNLYQDAKSELDAVGFNAQLAGERQQGDLSGRAIEKLQAAGTIELNQDYSLLANWEKRIYRQIWCRIKNTWTKEKWIRITDDQDALRWVGLNTQITARQFLEEKINDESLPHPVRKQYAASYTALTQIEQGEDINAAQMASAQLEAFVGVQNPVPEIDADIILDQSFDTVNIQQEQFQLLAQFAQGGDIDIIELIELSQLRGKDELIEKIEQRRIQQAEMAGNVAQKEAQRLDVQNARDYAQAQKTTEEAKQKAVETQILINQPERVTQVAI